MSFNGYIRLSYNRRIIALVEIFLYSSYYINTILSREINLLYKGMSLVEDKLIITIKDIINRLGEIYLLRFNLSTYAYFPSSKLFI